MAPVTSVDSHEGADATRDPRGREVRLVRDEEGRLWRVREVLFADTSPSLIFESELGFRRVRRYPGEWRSLEEEQLFALSWKT